MQNPSTSNDVTNDNTVQDILEEYISTFSESAVQELVDLLIRKGYFHDDHDKNDVTDEPRGLLHIGEDDDNYEVFTRQQKQKSPTVYLSDDSTCQLVLSRDGGLYMTRSYLGSQLLQKLQDNGGRLSLEQAAALLNVNFNYIQRAATEVLLKLKGDDDLHPNIQQVGNDLIHSSHLEQLTVTAKEVLQTRGQLSLSEIANQIFHLPLDLTLNLVTEQMVGCDDNNNDAPWMVTTISGSKMLVSLNHWDEMREEMYQRLLNATQPTSLSMVCQETLGWSMESCNSLVLPWLRSVTPRHKSDDGNHSATNDDDQPQKQQLLGEFHESGSVQGAMYVPLSYTQSQRQAVDDFFVTNGYITTDQCKTFGLRPSKLHEFVQESFPQAIALSDAVLHPDVLITPLEAVLQQAVDDDDTLVDLSLHLPSALLSQVSVCRAMVHDLVLTSLAERGGKEPSELGICVITNQDAHFYCFGLVERIRRTIVPVVIERFAKRKATELDELESPSRSAKTIPGGVDTDSKAKEKRKAKKAQRETSKTSSVPESESQTVVPLLDVALAVVAEFPMFSELMEKPVASSPQSPQWEASEDDEGEIEWISGGPLCEFCRAALYTDDFRKQCQQSVEVELKRLRSQRESKASVVSRKDAASKIRSVEQSFEDPSCFATACYLLQLRAKALSFMATSGVDQLTYADLEKEFLQGCCADFASRVTQYYLFKQGADDGLFSFTLPDELVTQAEESDVPVFCRPVDLAMRQYPKVYLSCQQKDAGRLPLSMLRDEGGVGVQLARMWNFCGGHCFEGGTRMSYDDGIDITKPGNVDEFLAHAEDNCLMICGLPYKKLDKKSEKSTLFTRRQALAHLLERAENPKDVLELTIMILFQQVKNIVVCGDQLTGPILDLLRKEKKIPEDVGNALSNLAEGIAKSDLVEAELVKVVRECGLSRDISKHSIGH